MRLLVVLLVHMAIASRMVSERFVHSIDERNQCTEPTELDCLNRAFSRSLSENYLLFYMNIILIIYTFLGQVEGEDICYELIRAVVGSLDIPDAILGGEAFSGDVNKTIFIELRSLGDFYHTIIENIVNKEIGDDSISALRWKNIARELITMVLATERLTFVKLVSGYRNLNTIIDIATIDLSKIHRLVLDVLADLIYICHDSIHMLKSLVTVLAHKLETTSPKKPVYKPEHLPKLTAMAGPLSTSTIIFCFFWFTWLLQAQWYVAHQIFNLT